MRQKRRSARPSCRIHSLLSCAVTCFVIDEIMSRTAADLPEDPAELRRFAEALAAEVHAKTLLIEKLKMQLAVLRRKAATQAEAGRTVPLRASLLETAARLFPFAPTRAQARALVSERVAEQLKRLRVPRVPLD